MRDNWCKIELSITMANNGRMHYECEKSGFEKSRSENGGETMRFSFIFAPLKAFKSRYSSEGIPPSSYQMSDGEKVDKIISKAIKPQIAALYVGEDSVKLVGFSYKQYDENGWSFYPLQPS